MRGEEPSGWFCPRWGCRKGWNQRGPRHLQASAARGKVSQVVLGRFSLTGRAGAPQGGLGSPPSGFSAGLFSAPLLRRAPCSQARGDEAGCAHLRRLLAGVSGFPLLSAMLPGSAPRHGPAPHLALKLPLLPSLGVLRRGYLWASHGSGHLGLQLAWGVDSTKLQLGEARSML